MRRTRAFTLIETMCMVLLLTAIGVVVLAFSDTFTNSITIASDVLTSEIQQRQFNIAFRKVCQKAKYTTCSLAGGGAYSKLFPYDNNPSIVYARTLLPKRENLRSEPSPVPMTTPPWDPACGVYESVGDGEGSPSTTIGSNRILFYLHSEKLSLSPLFRFTKADQVIATLALSCALVNVHPSFEEYACVGLYSGYQDTNKVYNLDGTLKEDNANLIAKYSVKLKKNDNFNGYFCRTIQYYPQLDCYAFVLPSNLHSVAATAMTQLNLYRMGIFSPGIAIMP